MIIMYMPNVACRLKAILVISSEFSNAGNDLLQFDLIHLRFILFYFSNFTELLVLLHSIGLIVGNPNNKSMMNFEFHLPYLSMDPD